MPRPSKFDRKQIIRAARLVARREGFRGVSARAVAKELGASTSVIYGHFDSVERLQHDLIAYTVQKHFFPIMPAVAAEGLRPLVHAFCRLGREDTWLAEQLSVSSQANPAWAAGRALLAQALGGLPRFAHLSEPERLALVSRFTMACVGVAICWAYGELTDIDAGYDAVVEPVMTSFLASPSGDDLLAGSAG